MRGRAWTKSRGRAISDADAGELLKATVTVAGVFGAMFLVWGLVLYQYGDPYAQGHVVFYMGVTVISGIFCLMHLRSAALLLTGVTVIPFTLFFLATGRPVFIAIVNRRPKLTPDRRPKLTLSVVTRADGSARPGGAGRGCAAGASA
ncbi:MAG: hypothetical protein ACLPSW_21270, partial [Roseiarcus sp.]